MAETTTDETKMTREEAATFLQSIADDLGSGKTAIEIPVGNKDIQLSPPETVELETTVNERSRRLRKDVEEVTLKFTWSPTRDTAESDSTSESGTETEPDTNQ